MITGIFSLSWLVYSPFSWDVGMAQMAIQVYPINLKGIRLGGNVAPHFEPVMNANY